LLVAIDAAALEERISIIRAKTNRFFKVGDGVVGIPFAGMEEPALEKGLGGARVQDDGLIEVGEGALNVVPVVRPDHGAPESGIPPRQNSDQGGSLLRSRRWRGRYRPCTAAQGRDGPT